MLFWSTAIAAEMEYRINFILASLSSLGNLAGSVFGLFLFYQNDYQFKGWSWNESLIVLGVFTILQGFSSIFLLPNLNRIVDYVQQGTLDFVLLKPINSQFWVSTRILSPWGIPDLWFGGLILTYAAMELNLGWQTFSISAIPLGFGFLSLYSIWFMLAATSIWFVKIYNVTEVLRGLLEAGRFPMSAYPVVYRFFFTFIIPVAFITTVPAEAMLGRADASWIVGTGILAIGLFMSSIAFWRFALKFYTSASS